MPFSFVFDQAGHLLVTEAAKSGVTSYALRKDGTLDVITPSVESGQQVLCWITRAGRFFYGTNPGSSTISLYTVDSNGRVSIGGEDGVIADAGGPESVAEVGVNGDLTLVETETEGLPVFADGSGMEGLVVW